MGHKGRVRLRKLGDELIRAYPSIGDPETVIAQGAVAVNGRTITNPESLVRRGAAITLRRDEPLRGEAKLEAALAAFRVDVGNRVALDAGAAAGGFPRALRSAGARRVYAVDAGHGQLLGSLRQDGRVVNLERTNLGRLDRRLVPDAVEIVTLDLSYLALAEAVPQLRGLRIADGCPLLALVKPQFELRLAEPPSDEPSLQHALELAADGIAAAGWHVVSSIRSPLRGARGSIELFIHARKDTR